MRVLIDMNLSPSWAPFLKSIGFEATHWSEVGESGAPDQSLVDWAAEHDHVLMTNDLDFSAILATTRQRKPSVIQIRSARRTPASIGALVARAIFKTEQHLAEGALVAIDASRIRVRILPLRS